MGTNTLRWKSKKTPGGVVIQRNNKGGYELDGLAFGRITVIRRSSSARSDGCRMWDCVCECGTRTVVGGTQLVTGKTLSCGCYGREVSSHTKITHGETHSCRRNQKPSGEYNSYHAAKNRCQSPGNMSYHLYGGRGIEFRFTSFEQFLQVVGRRPTPKHSIDRYPDKNGHYEPGNVRWATSKQQIRNRRTTVVLVYRGHPVPLADLSEMSGIAGKTILGRVRLGWCVDCAVDLPLNQKRGKKGNKRVCPHT